MVKQTWPDQVLIKMP